MKVKCKNDFVYNGSQISLKDDGTLGFFKPNSWVKDKEYKAKYYDGGCMCPVQAYFVKSENNDEFIFSIREAKPTYELFSEHFELLELSDSEIIEDMEELSVRYARIYQKKEGDEMYTISKKSFMYGVHNVLSLLRRYKKSV
jgi:hypothetical protein